MRIPALLLVTILATQATARDSTLPRLYHVIDTTADDRLNVRAAPSASAAILGSLAHDATRVEILRLSGDGQWGRIETEDGPGWVFMRFMQIEQAHTNERISAGLNCGGIKPDWGLRIDPYSDNTGYLAIADWLEGEDPAHINWGAGSENHPGMAELYEFEVGSGWLTFVLIPGQCGDGRSRREYGLRFLGNYFSNDDEGSSIALEGCCTQQLDDPHL